MQIKNGLIVTAVSMLLGGASLSAHAQSQGVSSNEILIGSIQDLSAKLIGNFIKVCLSALVNSTKNVGPAPIVEKLNGFSSP